MDNLIPYTSLSSKQNSRKDSITFSYTAPDPRLNANWVCARWSHQTHFYVEPNYQLILAKIEGVIFFSPDGIEGCVLRNETDPAGVPFPTSYLKVYEDISKQMKQWIKEYKSSSYEKFKLQSKERNLKQEFVRFI